MRCLTFLLALCGGCSWAEGLYAFKIDVATIVDDSCELGPTLLTTASFVDVAADGVTVFSNPATNEAGIVLSGGVPYTEQDDGTYAGEWEVADELPPRKMRGSAKDRVPKSFKPLGPCTITDTGSGSFSTAFDASMELTEVGVLTQSGDCLGIQLPDFPCSYEVEYQGMYELYY